LSTATFEVPGLPLAVELRRHSRARRLRLRVDHERKLLRLTMPVRGSARSALQWAGEQRAWVEQQLARAPAGVTLEDGAIIPFRGAELRIRWFEGAARAPRLNGPELVVGGPAENVPRRVEHWLRGEARRVLSHETARIAAEAGVTVSRVSVGDPASRWGSCSASGSIRYSWRLILAPPEALRFVVAHEVAHRLHMDHSASFKQAEERLFGGPVSAARGLLREFGPTLRLIGRG
jgi:predicted metal-dependent hydrolase